MTEKPVNIAILGIGAMGKGLFYQSTIASDVQCVAVSDLDISRCTECLDEFGAFWQMAYSVEDAAAAINSGFVAVCENGSILTELDIVEVFVDATSSIAEAGLLNEQAIQNGKNVVLMNSEVDLIFGPYLSKLADQHGVVYSSCDGDQYGVIKRLIDQTQSWGFETVMAGNIKGFLDRYANPEMIVPEADKRNLDYRMCTSYTDGTKLNIEMALLANALGYRTDIPGMHGPKIGHVIEALTCFDLEKLRGEGSPVVDYVLGAEPGGGIYVVGYCNNTYQMGMMSYYKMGDGPFYIFYRPYHLCHVEAMDTIVQAARCKRSLMKPEKGFRTQVVAYAKVDLEQGATLDGLGGFTCYGMIENVDGTELSEGLPICLADNVTVLRKIRKDERILMTDIQIPHHRTDFVLFSKAVNSSRELQK